MEIEGGERAHKAKVKIKGPRALKHRVVRKSNENKSGPG